MTEAETDLIDYESEDETTAVAKEVVAAKRLKLNIYLSPLLIREKKSCHISYRPMFIMFLIKIQCKHNEQATNLNRSLFVLVYVLFC